ncbi:uncharacterized protein LOC135112068 [Scylla paramamosain]|uniref:uncharacterized protein LOC135112068 n=1 Tax=Scylla paramamosain TaxID=85552 RepID=UPI0030834F9B
MVKISGSTLITSAAAQQEENIQIWWQSTRKVAYGNLLKILWLKPQPLSMASLTSHPLIAHPPPHPSLNHGDVRGLPLEAHMSSQQWISTEAHWRYQQRRGIGSLETLTERRDITGA